MKKPTLSSLKKRRRGCNRLSLISVVRLAAFIQKIRARESVTIINILLVMTIIYLTLLQPAVQMRKNLLASLV
jgi:type II secretory pathway component PulM